MRGIIWGADRDACGGRLKRLIEEYETYWKVKPLKIRETKEFIKVEFENGDMWETQIPTKLNTFGLRCNVSLIDSNIDEELTSRIEVYTTRRPPYGAIDYF